MISEIKIGFLRGVGFVIVAVLCAAIVSASIMLINYRNQAAHISQEIENYGEYTQFTSDTKLRAELLSHEQVEDRLIILGKLHNETRYKWNNIRIEAELFKSDEFVRECTETISAIVEEGGSEYFQVSCGCKKKAPTFDHIDLKVTDAWSSK